MAENVFATALVRILPDMSGFAASVRASITGSVATALPNVVTESRSVGLAAGAALTAGVSTSFESGLAAFAAKSGASYGPVIRQAEVAGASVATGLSSGLRSFGATAQTAAAQVTKSVGTAGDALRGLGVSATQMKVVAGAAVAAFAIQGALHFKELGEEVEKFKTIAGTSAEVGSRFVAVADDYGIGAETIARAVGFLGRTLGTNENALAQYGVAVAKTASGHTDLAQTTFNVIDAYNAMQDPAEKSKLAAVAFGRGFQALIPLITEGSDKIKESFNDVSSAQLFNDEKLRQAKDFGLIMDDLKDSFTDLQINIGRAMIPTLETFATVTATAVNGLSALNDATEGVSGKALSFVAVGAATALALTALVNIGSRVVSSFNAIKAAMITTTGEMTTLATTASLAAGAVGVLALAWVAGNWLKNSRIDIHAVDDAVKQLIIDLAKANDLSGADGIRSTLDALAAEEVALARAGKGQTVYAKNISDAEILMIEGAKGFKKAIDDALSTDPGAAKGIVDALVSIKIASDGGDESARKYLASLGLTGKTLDEVISHLRTAVDAQKAQNGELEESATGLTGLARATEINSAMMIRAHEDEVKAADVLKEANKRLTEEMKPLILTYQEATDSIKAKVAAMSEEATAALGLNNANLATQNADLRLTEATKKYQETLNGIPPSLTEIAGAQDALTAATEAYHKTTAVTITSDLDKERALIRLQVAQQKLAEATLGASRAEKEAAANSSADALQKYLDVMKDTTATTLDRQKALADLHAAQEKQADVEGKGKNADLDRRQAVVDVADAQKAYDDALKGTTGSAEQQAAALKNMEDAQKRLNDVSKGTVFTEDEKRQAYLDVLAAVNNVATAHDNEAKAQATAKGAHYDVRDSILAEIDSLTKIEASLNGPTKTAVGDHITQLETELGLYDALKAAADALTQNAGYAPGYGPRVGPGGGIPQFDMGGMVPGPLGAPMLAIVHGGEIVVPPVGGMAGQGYLKGAPPTHQQPTYAPAVADNANPWPDQMTLVIEGTPFTAMIKREQADLAASIRAGRR